MKNITIKLQTYLEKLLTIRNNFITCINVAREMSFSKKLYFRKTMKYNVFFALIITNILYRNNYHSFLIQYFGSQSILVPMFESMLFILIAVIYMCKRKQFFTENIEQDNKHMKDFAKFVDIMRILTFNALICSLFYSCCMVIYEPLSYKILAHVLLTSIMTAMGAFSILGSDEFYNFIPAIRLYKIGYSN